MNDSTSLNISIIVPVYNVENYLKECLDSILAQTYKNIQVLLVDDGSKDNSGKIAQEYAAKDSRLRYIYQDNKGLSGARNTGIKKADGEYIAVVDSDDWVEPDYIETMLKTALEKDADVTVCGFVKESKEPKELRIENRAYSRTSAMGVLSNIFTDEYLVMNVAWNKLYKKNIFDKVQYAEGKLHEDEYTIHRVIDQADLICTIDKVLYHYRLRDDSIMGSLNTENMRHFDIVDAHLDRVSCCRNQLYGEFYRLIVYSLFEEIIWLMPRYNHDTFKKYRLNRKFRWLMIRECIKNYAQLDKNQKREYLPVIINPEKYIRAKLKQ